jgi:DNA-binding HxlR family transcriptional regulator
MKDPTNPICRTISTLLSRIGDKWTALVVQTLGDGPKRFNELRREIPSVSQRMLTLTLRNLERDGLLTRTVYPTVPPKTEYRLTEAAHELTETLSLLTDWAKRHQAHVHESRTAYDERKAADQDTPVRSTGSR